MEDMKIFDLSTGERCHYPFVLPTSVHYDPDAVCPRWNQFIDEITCGNAALQTYLKRMAGYCMTDSTTEQVMFVLLGNGGNGKSTFINILQMLMGEYAKHSHTGLLYGSVNRNWAPLSRCKNCRLLVLGEPNSNEKLCASAVNQLVSDGGRIVGRELYQKDCFEFVPKFKIVVTANYMPEVDEDVAQTMQRVRVVPFKAEFSSDTRDCRLSEKLGYELPGILNWAFAGAAEWYEHGLPNLEKVEC